MDLSWESLKAAHLLIQRWRDKTAIWAKDKSLDQKQAQGFIDEISADFSADLDTPRALQKLRTIEKAQTLSDGVKYEIFKSVDELFGLDLLKPALGKGELTSEIQNLFDQRQLARNKSDFDESDRLRQLLLKEGVVVRDSKDGQSWEWLI
jgi:cysteinyl-tRNA synthetase